MRRMINLILAFLLVPAMLLAKKQPAGELIGDTLYHDLAYDFNLRLADGWKIAKINQEQDIYRMAITQRSPVIPAHFQEDRSYFTAPKLTILAEKNALSADSLAALIINRKQEGKLIKEALRTLATISVSQFTPTFGRPVKLKFGEFQGVMIPVRKDYRYEVDMAGSALPKLVNDFIRGTVFVLKKGELTLEIETAAEQESYGLLEKEFEAMMKSLGKTAASTPADSGATPAN